MGLLTSNQVESWRKARIDFFERVIQGNLKKLSLSMAIFHGEARENGLKPSETRYVRPPGWKLSQTGAKGGWAASINRKESRAKSAPHSGESRAGMLPGR